jgi:hypothetical protein
MKLDQDLFPTNMNTIELDGKKVLVMLSYTESTKGKGVIIGEERPSRMIKSKSPKDGQWQKSKRTKSQQCPKATLDMLMAKYKEGMASIWGRENQTNLKSQTEQSSFPESD